MAETGTTVPPISEQPGKSTQNNDHAPKREYVPGGQGENFIPFCGNTEHADRPFLKKAMELSDSVYSIHMANTIDFLEEYVSSFGREIVARATYNYNIPHTFTFHNRRRIGSSESGMW